jgi:DNA mismatch endonuclease, patch repair protein
MKPSPHRRRMQAVGRRDTDLELLARRPLWRAGFRYRINRPTLGTRPDIVFVAAKVAVFVDGCFWHGCPRHYSAPSTNVDFWRRKLKRNRARDRANSAALKVRGWRVMRFWGCELHDDAAAVVQKIARAVETRRRKSK